MNVFVIIHFLYLIISCKSSHSKSFTGCDLTSDSQCLLDDFRKFLAQLDKPMPKYNLPSLNPLNLTDVGIRVCHKYAQFKEFMRYLAVYDLSSATVEVFSIDLSKKNLHLLLTFRNYHMESQFSLVGAVINDAVKTNNYHANFYYTNTSLSYTAELSEYKQDDVKYFKVENGQASWKFIPDCVKPVYTTKENQKFDKILIREFLEISVAFRTQFINIIAESFSRIANNVLQKIPAQTLLGQPNPVTTPPPPKC